MLEVTRLLDEEKQAAAKVRLEGAVAVLEALVAKHEREARVELRAEQLKKEKDG